MKTKNSYTVYVRRNVNWVKAKECKTRDEALELLSVVSGSVDCKIVQHIEIESVIYEDGGLDIRDCL